MAIYLPVEALFYGMSSSWHTALPYPDKITPFEKSVITH